MAVKKIFMEIDEILHRKLRGIAAHEGVPIKQIYPRALRVYVESVEQDKAEAKAHLNN